MVLQKHNADAADKRLPGKIIVQATEGCKMRLDHTFMVALTDDQNAGIGKRCKFTAAFTVAVNAALLTAGKYAGRLQGKTYSQAVAGTSEQVDLTEGTTLYLASHLGGQGILERLKQFKHGLPVSRMRTSGLCREPRA